MLSTQEKKTLLTEIAAKIEKQNERREAYLKELTDDKGTLELIQEKIDASAEMPDYSSYSSLEEWKEGIEKEIKRTNATLANLDTKLIEAEAFRYYATNFTEG